MKSTSSYIYNTLFINGENSDILVRALDKDWRLHKLYLCQSLYFDSMFKGSNWKEASQDRIEIAIPDSNIDERALFTAFGSFYKEEIEIMPLEVVSILACASLFSLEGLIAQCESIMIENMSAHTVLSYYEASLNYGVNNVTQNAFKWLCNNLMINLDLRLGEISSSLLEKILDSPDLLIIRVETDLYSVCKRWLYYQLNKNVQKLDNTAWQKVTSEFFKNELKKQRDYLPSSKKSLLDYGSYSEYVNVFKKIRFKNLIRELPSLKLLYSEKIIPASWIEPCFMQNWLTTLYIDQHNFSHEYEINRAEFEKECMRFGRILSDESHLRWRWVWHNDFFLK
jgi:BTB/POZ domain-containing protein 13